MKRLLIALLIVLTSGCAFYLSPVHYVSDSAFSLLMDEAILHYGTPNMIPYEVPRGPKGDPSFNGNGYLWPIDKVKGRLLYKYSWGSALLSLPVVAAFNQLGFTVAPNHIY